MAKKINAPFTHAQEERIAEIVANALVNALAGMNAQTPAPAKAKAKATKKAVTKGKGNAKADANAQARLAYKQDKRTRNCLTSAENKLVAKQMREQGLNPSDKKAWEKAKAAYIKANPLV